MQNNDTPEVSPTLFWMTLGFAMLGLTLFWLPLIMLAIS
jgi:hypothetical protein